MTRINREMVQIFFAKFSRSISSSSVLRRSISGFFSSFSVTET
ncbi:unnamed protein product [Arabidopsis thaliana]|uniref:Uncharacterized protein n=3 Tax=Arabidopsis TaxID=3701 RepID=A0A5S9XC52_ARATH|nr:hypothetical protein ISN45_At03g014010 [Arabidopsis thaliana x Arabidopsis arenosa]KAG7631156.1 hypothetical protein ISN44_As03g014070 [Arabidopsis suecica]CAA0382345.1 unnamed protein product [Arabidopsis thaliana]VYS57293.1 unnamed protein product [Arabidopsis thaliana]